MLSDDGRILSYDNTTYNADTQHTFEISAVDEASLLFDISKVQTHTTAQTTPVE